MQTRHPLACAINHNLPNYSKTNSTRYYNPQDRSLSFCYTLHKSYLETEPFPSIVVSHHQNNKRSPLSNINQCKCDMKPFFGLSSLFIRPADSEPICLIWHHNPFTCKSPAEISIHFKNRSVSDCSFIRGLTIISLVSGHSLSHRWIKKIKKNSLNTWHDKCFFHVHDRFSLLQILSRYTWKISLKRKCKCVKWRQFHLVQASRWVRGFSVILLFGYWDWLALIEHGHWHISSIPHGRVSAKEASS